MKKSVRFGVISVLLALVIGWLWSVRLIGYLYAQESNNYEYEDTPTAQAKVLPLNPWPNLITDEDSPEYDIQPIIDKMPRLGDLAKKSSLSSTEKAQMAFLASRMFSTSWSEKQKSRFDSRINICKAGQRLDPGNGLYPMLEAMVRFEMALDNDAPKTGRGQMPTIPGRPGPMPPLPTTPRPDRKPGQSEPQIPPMTMPPGGTPNPSASATMAPPPMLMPSAKPKPQDKRPEPSYTVVDRIQFLQAIQAYVRSSKLPIQRHTLDVMPLKVNRPVLVEHYLTNQNMMMADMDVSYGMKLRELTRQLASVGPKLAQMGYKAEAQQLMTSLLPFASQLIRTHDGRVMDALFAKLVLKYNQTTAMSIASTLGQTVQKRKYEQTKHKIDVFNPQMKVVLNRPISNGGWLIKNVSDAVGSSAPLPASKLAAARMAEFTILDEAVVLMLLIAWLMLLVAGMVRSGVWLLICRKTDTSVPELDWQPELRQMLIWWLLVPLAVYTLLTQAAWMPWRSGNIGLATGIEKTTLMALSLIVPWVIWRYRFKKMCTKHAIPMPSKGVEVLWNWLPVIGLVPLLVMVIIWRNMLEETPDMPIGSTPIVLALVFLALWLASVISVFALKQKFRAYYAAAGRYIQPLLVWSILVVSLTLLPVLLAREVVWLQRDNLGIGSSKKLQLSLPVEAQSARWLEGKLLEAIR